MFEFFLLKTKHIETLLDFKDEAYGNTPLHIAVSLYSDTLVSLLLGVGRKQLETVNIAGKTPLGVLEEEVKYVDGELNQELRALKLERLDQIR